MLALGYACFFKAARRLPVPLPPHLSTERSEDEAWDRAGDQDHGSTVLYEYCTVLVLHSTVLVPETSLTWPVRSTFQKT